MADPIGSFSGLASGIQWRDMVDQIMSIERARRVDPLEKQQSTNKSRSDAWTSFQGLVGKLTSAAKTLQDGSAFGKFKVNAGQTAAGKALFSASAAEGAAPGSYAVKVEALAQAEKLKSRAFASPGEAAGVSGEVLINGRAVELAATDTLAGIRDKINAANSGTGATGVTATILTKSEGENYLVLTSGATGAHGIELTDSAGGALQGVGVASGWAANQTAAGAAQSAGFSSKTSTLASMLGLKTPPNYREVVIGGQAVTVDFTTDTLESLLQKVRAQDAGAKIVEEQAGGRTSYRLELSAGQSATATDDTTRLLGFEQSANAAGAVIAEGADARVFIDGFEIRRPTNTIGGALQGITLSLQAAAPGETVTLDVQRDTDAIVNAVRGLASAYNEVRAFQEKQNTIGSPLFANGTLRSTVAQLTNVLLTDLKGLPSNSLFNRGATVGLALSKTGTLEVDEAKLRSALDTNLADVKALFGTAGTASGEGLEYVASGSKTQSGSYRVEITQAATRAAFTGAAADPSAATGTEKLTIKDGASGKSLVYAVPAGGKSLDDVVGELNAQFAVQKMKLTATTAGGALRLESSEYGSAASFTLSDGETATDGSVSATGGLARLGLAGASVDPYKGADVQGYLYTDAAQKGELLTGSGRILTGAAGTAAEGLQVKYSGSGPLPATVGTAGFTLGLAGAMARQSDLVGRSGDGTIALQIESIQAGESKLATRIEDAEAILERRRESMIKQFAAMEKAMSQITAQGSWLTQQIQAMRPRTD